MGKLGLKDVMWLYVTCYKNSGAPFKQCPWRDEYMEVCVYPLRISNFYKAKEEIEYIFTFAWLPLFISCHSLNFLDIALKIPHEM